MPGLEESDHGRAGASGIGAGREARPLAMVKSALVSNLPEVVTKRRAHARRRSNFLSLLEIHP
ncbi:MAG: hypothetical protein OEQ13_14170 [Acidobacteriota bacterium]|nr:hypothetical protein [Acidobacteriota bacterium]